MTFLTHLRYQQIIVFITLFFFISIYLCRHIMTPNYLVFFAKMAGAAEVSFLSTGACNLEVPGSNPGRADICHRGCAYTVHQAVQRHGM